MSPHELIVDSFAGGGGASLGITWALGRSPDIAINHDKESIALHAANHPGSRHYAEDVWKVDPRAACAGRPVGLMWLSPDCKHFSKAKGGKPVSKKIRGLAWIAVRWAQAVRPRVIVLENVEEFQTWGPVLATGLPCPRRRGATFRAFRRKLERLGYAVEHRELRACDYGAPTIRKRLFLIARCDGLPIRWPAVTHGKGAPTPWRTAAECIEWSVPCPSIFERMRPLAENTLKRIARGIRRFVIESPNPFIVPAQYWNRPTGIDEPLQTVTGRGTQLNLAIAHISKFKGTGTGQSPDEPLHTVQSGGLHYADVRAFLVAYYGQEKDGADLFGPMRTLSTRDRFGLVSIHGIEYAIADIGMRMLLPRELYRAQGFPDSYAIDIQFNGKPMTKTAQVRMCGNSVCPPLAEAIVRANLGMETAVAVA